MVAPPTSRSYIQHGTRKASCRRSNNAFLFACGKAYGTVSAKIAPRLKCYKNASRLNRYNFPMDNAIDFLVSILHTTPFHYEVLKIGSR